VVSLLYRSSGGTRQYEYGDAPPQDGRLLWWWPYKELRQYDFPDETAWTVRCTARVVPARIGIVDDRFHR